MLCYDPLQSELCGLKLKVHGAPQLPYWWPVPRLCHLYVNSMVNLSQLH